MTDYKTLRVPEEQYHEAKEQKEEHDRTWGEQLLQQELHDGPEIFIENVEVTTGESGVTADDVETIVENWIENNYDALRRGNV